MRPQHWVLIAVILLVGYGLGIYFPSYGQAAVAKVTGA